MFMKINMNYISREEAIRRLEDNDDKYSISKLMKKINESKNDDQ